MVEIEKKVDPDYFELISQGKKHVEIRLNDFDANIGDILVLREFDREKQFYTQRVLMKKITQTYIVNLDKWFSMDDIKKMGIRVIEFK